MEAVPASVRQAGPDTLAIDWQDGETSEYNVLNLRLACPCAMCQDEMTGERTLDPKKVPPDVRPAKIVGVGNYAIQIIWSDGHDTGIYSFDRLRRLANRT